MVKRTVFKFDTPAKLILINAHSSYLELKNGNNGENKCLWCSNSKAHEHDIIGKVKFEPKEKTYLVSLVEKLVKSKKAGLEITPSQMGISKQTDHQQAKMYPMKAVKNEIEGAQYFARRIVRQEGQVSCASIKYGDNNRHLMISSPKSVLKTSQTASLPHSKCDKCMKNNFSKLSEVQLHFMNVHQYNVQIKDISMRKDTSERKTMPEEDDEGLEDTEAEFVCTFSADCLEKFDSDENRILHMNEKHDQRQCHKCLQHFKTPVTFRKHQCGKLQEEQKVRNHSCHLCAKKFLKAPHLRAHLQTTHLGAKLYVCEACDKRYASAFALKTHKVNVHGIGGEKPECPHCPRTFCNKTLLRRHILESHEKDKRRSCSICGLFYLRRDKLEAHMASVHGQAFQPNPCKLCSKVYSNKEKLGAHLRTVHGILPWNKIQVLQIDSKPHELKDDNVLKCKYCEQAFLPAEMENHLRFSHGVMPVTSSDQLTISEAAEALLKTLTPQPDYLLRSLTPLPMETLDELMDSALSKE